MLPQGLLVKIFVDSMMKLVYPRWSCVRGFPVVWELMRRQSCSLSVQILPVAVTAVLMPTSAVAGSAASAVIVVAVSSAAVVELSAVASEAEVAAAAVAEAAGQALFC